MNLNVAPLASATHQAQHILFAVSYMALAQTTPRVLSVVALAAILLVVTFIAAMVRRAARWIAVLVARILQLAVTIVLLMLSGVIAVMVVSSIAVYH